ncbi:hypothetical protein KUCAC02_033776 [Chaenocephalus aceratus]|nr:hypothetical protein KUCAC02_033776 [Chaenocephalus aceratus]
MNPGLVTLVETLLNKKEEAFKSRDKSLLRSMPAPAEEGQGSLQEGELQQNDSSVWGIRRTDELDFHAAARGSNSRFVSRYSQRFYIGFLKPERTEFCIAAEFLYSCPVQPDGGLPPS